MRNYKGARKQRVYYGYHGRSTKRIPVIRLGGQYLSDFEFDIGDTIEITPEAGRIVITKVPATQACENNKA